MSDQHNHTVPHYTGAMDFDFDDDTLVANVPGLLAGFAAHPTSSVHSPEHTVHLQLGDTVAGGVSATFSNQCPPDPVSKESSDAVVVCNQTLVNSRDTPLGVRVSFAHDQTSALSTVSEDTQLCLTTGEASGQTLMNFLEQVTGGVDTEGEGTFLQPVENSLDSQLAEIADTTVPNTESWMTNSLTNNMTGAYITKNDVMDLCSTLPEVYNSNSSVSTPVNIPSRSNQNLLIRDQLSVPSGYVHQVTDMDESSTTVDSCPSASPLTQQATSALTHGLQQFNQDINEHYSANLVTVDKCYSSDTDMGVSEDGDTEQHTCGTDFTQTQANARTRRRTRRNRSRMSESSADVNSPEYKAFLSSLSSADRKRELNRQAAKRCRDKKFEEEKRLEERAKFLRRQNSKLKAEKERLQNEAKTFSDSLQLCAHIRQMSAQS